MKKYYVKLNEGHKAKADQITKDGYLGNYSDTLRMVYSRGEAIKKARVFGGSLELIPITTVFSKATITQISEDALLHSVVEQLRGREAFTDNTELTGLNERIYEGSVFEAILEEQGELEGTPMELNKKTLNQLYELSVCVETDYVQIIDIKVE